MVPTQDAQLIPTTPITHLWVRTLGPRDTGGPTTISTAVLPVWLALRCPEEPLSPNSEEKKNRPESSYETQEEDKKRRRRRRREKRGEEEEKKRGEKKRRRRDEDKEKEEDKNNPLLSPQRHFSYISDHVTMGEDRKLPWTGPHVPQESQDGS